MFPLILTVLKRDCGTPYGNRTSHIMKFVGFMGCRGCIGSIGFIGVFLAGFLALAASTDVSIGCYVNQVDYPPQAPLKGWWLRVWV